MNYFDERKSNSKTIENLDFKNLIKDKKRYKHSKSHNILNIHPKDLINNFKYHETLETKNSLSLSECQTEIINENSKDFFINNANVKDSYDEEINYNIDEMTNKNDHDTTDSSKIKKGNEIKINNEKINETNFYCEHRHKNFCQKEYWLEEKNRYIQELEKQIQFQQNTINNLLKNKKLFQERIFNINNKNKQNFDENENFFVSLENNQNYGYSNRKMLKKLSKEDIKNRTYYNKFNNKTIEKISNTLEEKEKNLKDKYNALYSKYLQLNNDFKYLNNNNSLIEINQIKYKYSKLKQEYKILRNIVEQKNKIIEKQKNEINKIKNNENCKIQYILGGNEEKEIIKNLKQQVEVFRKDLVLSQAMVNSLKSELEHLNKNNNKNISHNLKTNLNRSNTMDDYIFTFNDNKSINQSITPVSQSGKIINYNDIIYNNDNQKNLINSLNNKNKLLAKVLAENNQLRKRLQKFDSFLPEFEDKTYIDEKLEELNDKKIIKKYEEKFRYFNRYIKKVKAIIAKIFGDIPQIINKFTSKIENKYLSDKCIFDLYRLRKEYNDIKKIDFYNLDITDDENCITIFNNINKILIEELEKMIKDKKVENENNQKYLYNIKTLKINDLNGNKNSNFDNNINNIIKKEKFPIFDNDILLKNNKDKKKNISDLKKEYDKKTINQKVKYNFEYGKNTDESEFLDNNYKTVISNNNIEI